MTTKTSRIPASPELTKMAKDYAAKRGQGQDRSSAALPISGVATGREAMDLIRKAQAAAKAPAAKTKGAGKGKVTAPKEKRITSGGRIREMIMEGKLTVEEILAVIHREFPEGNAGPSDVAWNRGKLRRDGVKNVPTAADVLKARGLPANGSEPKPPKARVAAVTAAVRALPKAGKAPLSASPRAAAKRAAKAAK